MIATIVSIVLLAACIGMIWYIMQGPFFVPTLALTVAQMVELSGIKPGQKFADLGSGDGRVVVAFARAGAQATGFEINPLLVWYSRWKIRRFKLSNAQILTSNFWHKNLGEYDCLTVFGIDHIMPSLGKKLVAELGPQAIVISNAFRIPGLTQIGQKGSLIIYKK
ncbi:MAG TPA: hypothetical protein VFX17_00150 [Patescibacteria group bacterium]|nr:hypothetical protein [Patescibacteria group bacterium]